MSSNIVGYAKITMNANGYTMIANPFVEVGTGDLIGIADMFSDDTENAIGGTSIAASDNIQVWNGASYDTYYLRENKKQGTKFWVNASGAATETTDTLPVHGGAFYVSRADVEAPSTLTISGEVRGNDEVIAIVPGYNLLENPFPVPLSFANFIVNGATGGTSISAADNIQLWNGTSYETYYLRENKKQGTKFWVNASGAATETTDTIAPYTGFFYLSRTNISFNVTLPTPIN